MSAFVADIVVVNQAYIDSTGINQGETLALGATVIVLQELSSNYNYLFACVDLKTTGNGTFTLTGNPANPTVSVRILANRIVNPLSITCMGAEGLDGEDGNPFPHPPGATYDPDLDEGQIGAPGNPGQNGGKGGRGGDISVAYRTAETAPVGSAPGGEGGERGRGGPGDLGGKPKPPLFQSTQGKPGKNGDDGAQGDSGTVLITILPDIALLNAEIPEELAARWKIIRPSLCNPE
ncbi:MAG: hypothetical protein QM758_05885 [Armatimonas sp.]